MTKKALFSTGDLAMDVASLADAQALAHVKQHECYFHEDENACVQMDVAKRTGVESLAGLQETISFQKLEKEPVKRRKK